MSQQSIISTSKCCRKKHNYFDDDIALTMITPPWQKPVILFLIQLTNYICLVIASQIVCRLHFLILLLFFNLICQEAGLCDCCDYMSYFLTFFDGQRIFCKHIESFPDDFITDPATNNAQENLLHILMLFYQVWAILPYSIKK